MITKFEVMDEMKSLNMAVGIDLGGTHIKGGLISADGVVIRKERVSTGVSKGTEAVIGRILELIKALTVGYAGRIVGLGMGVPGLINPKTGYLVTAPNLGWSNMELKKILGQRIHGPLFLDNDANLAALGEYWTGAGQGLESMLMVTVGTGIGSGLVFKGEIYRGSGGLGAELGHTVVDGEGPVCGCGNKGCVEALAAGPAIIRRYYKITDTNQLRSKKPIDVMGVKDIIEAARAGDQGAREAIGMAGRYLGMALVNVIQLIDPEKILIGGGVAAAGGLLLDPLRREMTERLAPFPGRTGNAIMAGLGNDAGIIGAAALVFQQKNLGSVK
ncbi:MAG: ROK family protein [Bacillota bacterium]